MLPKITVAMPAYNAGRYIEEAIESVLCQEGVDLELLVVDDGSTDDTADIVGKIDDTRCRLLQNPYKRGIGNAHNRVVRESQAPIVSHVDADDRLRRGALAKMVRALEANPRVGLAHCYFFDIDAQGETTLGAFRERRRNFLRERPVDLDYRVALRNSPAKANHLRTYRRDALLELGDFNEELSSGIDYEMALRLLERYEIRLVPEFLYARRVHSSNTTESLSRAQLWWLKYRIRRSVLRRGQVTYWSDANFDPGYFLLGEARRLRHRLRSRPERKEARRP